MWGAETGTERVDSLSERDTDARHRYPALLLRFHPVRGLTGGGGVSVTRTVYSSAGGNCPLVCLFNRGLGTDRLLQEESENWSGEVCPNFERHFELKGCMSNECDNYWRTPLPDMEDRVRHRPPEQSYRVPTVRAKKTATSSGYKWPDSGWDRFSLSPGKYTWILEMRCRRVGTVGDNLGKWLRGEFWMPTFLSKIIFLCWHCLFVLVGRSGKLNRTKTLSWSFLVLHQVTWQ